MNAKILKAKIEAIKDEADAWGQQLQQEQDDSEDAHSVWEDESEEDQGEEPDVIDNSEIISQLENTVEFLDNASSALDE